MSNEAARDTVRGVDPEYLRSRLNYDPESGEFVWRCLPSNPSMVGFRAGSDDRKGYRRICLDGVFHKAHRLAWLHFYGTPPALEIDHINSNKGDNRISNLREVTSRVNKENRRFADADARVPLLGVSIGKGGRYRAVIGVHGRQKRLGQFSTPEEAHAAYLNAKRSLHEGCTL